MKIQTFTETYFTQLENKYFQTNNKYLTTTKIIYTNHGMIFPESTFQKLDHQCKLEHKIMFTLN